MTPPNLNRALTHLHWENETFAVACQVSLRTVERWLSGNTPMPPRVAEWVTRAEQYHAALNAEWEARSQAWLAGNPVPEREENAP